jgi:predicted helicase
MSSPVSQYFAALQKDHSTGRAREHSYRPALKTLIEALNPSIIATNEPRREKCGAPDFILTQKDLPMGYGEVKDIGIDLDEEEASEQIGRYQVLNNLFLSDYLEFRFFLNGKKYETVRIGNLENGILHPNESEFEKLALLLKEFALNPSITITSAQQLAEMMANKAKLMKVVIFNALQDQENLDSALHEQFNAFRKILIHDMDESAFSDVYSQTIAYGLFVARFHDGTPENFTRREAQDLVPQSNPFLRKLFHHIAGPDLDIRIAWIVDALAEVFAHTDVTQILVSFGAATKREDPIIHFYETFLSSYDPLLRKSRGVYYTPEPVVSFIIRSVDSILKSQFSLAQGLADTSTTTIKIMRQGKTKKEQEQKMEVHRVQILDPAAGTGTFLNEIIKTLYKRFEGQQGIWESYVDQHLLPRLHGFELMMAPYTMCHLKLGLTLKQTGYKDSNQRLGVYLTNTLEEAREDYETLFASWLSQEANEASRIKKEMPIMVVIGNPPYSVSSSNKGEWIEKLVSDYKKDLHEGSINALSDDYVKFIRFAQFHVEKNGHGIVAMITNNSFLDGIVHRKMRQMLLEAFDNIFILNLHGDRTEIEENVDNNSKIRNVFDIQQGVSINIFVKTSKSKKNANVHYFNCYGSREVKYNFLWNSTIENIEWKTLPMSEPWYFFVEKDLKLSEEYEKGLRLDAIFNEGGNGVIFRKDNLLVRKHFHFDSVMTMLNDMKNLKNNELCSKYDFKETADWTLDSKREFFIRGKIEDVHPVTYRPFDTRYTYYPEKIISKIIIRGDSRHGLMHHMLAGPNLGLILARIMTRDTPYDSVFTTRYLSEKKSGDSTRSSCLYPLYLYTKNIQSELFVNSLRQPNLNPSYVADIAAKLNLSFIQDGKGNCKTTFGPEDLFDYIYAVLHSPAYRKRYNELLKIDFPRVPFTANVLLFWELVMLGRRIRLLHLLEGPELETLITQYPQEGSNVVEYVDFEGIDIGKVNINATQYFDSVPRIAWQFTIGGYQPAQKWLKDRKGNTLSHEDVFHYQKIIIALLETDRLMKEIDITIEKNSGWPLK